MLSLFNIGTKFWKLNYFWVNNAKKGKYRGGRKKASICVVQGIKKQDLYVSSLIIAFKNYFKTFKRCGCNEGMD